ncbi:MAG: hypothetical protein AUJ74_03805 [Candidatus Omnitrophica bacterium CG1_02_44_16]|nr:MAG: hypothetical protein AUJ74_03805 [Candidatus Omnitrophica bacterium CG1_02_44_16]
MFRRTKKYLTIQMLASLEPTKLKALSEKKTLKAFQRAALKVPAYEQFLKEHNAPVSSIKTIEDFKKLVPLLDKDKTFKLYTDNIKKLCVDSEINNIHEIVSSSGHSGLFSYSLINKKESAMSQDTIDFMLDYIFNVGGKKTLLINCLPMGVKIHSSLVTIADTSVRPDIVISAIKTFAASYEQIILIGENSFVKKCLEDGAESGIEWKKLKMHIVLGEEMLPENLRTYFCDILGVDPDQPDSKSLIGSSLGVAEFGLNIFYETKELIRIRRLLQRDRKFREALIKADPDNLPSLMQYNPLRFFVEESPKERGLSDIVLTNLQEEAVIPLVRYNIKDEGICVSFKHLKDTLAAFNYADYTPRVRLPLAAVWGRDKITLEEGFALRPEFVKELLYKEKTIAENITGNFKLSNSKAGLRIEIQTKKTTPLSEQLENHIRDVLITNIPAKAEIIIYPYRDFPHGMELNYEKKFQYI